MALSLRKKKEEIVNFANTHVGAIDAARKSLTELGIPSAPLATMVFEVITHSPWTILELMIRPSRSLHFLRKLLSRAQTTSRSID